MPIGYNKFESKKDLTVKHSPKNDAEEDYDEDDYYDDDEYEEDESDSSNAFKPYAGLTRPKEKGTSTSSSLFRNFLKNNVGKNIRKPIPSNDEETKVASEIFKKYSSVNLKRNTGNYNKVIARLCYK